MKKPYVDPSDSTNALLQGREDLCRGMELHTHWPGMELRCPPISGHFWVIGGRPGNYKTQLMVNLATDLALERQSVLFVSLELNTGEIMVQVAARLTALTKRRLKVIWNSGACSDIERNALRRMYAQVRDLDSYFRLHGTSENGRSIRDVVESYRVLKPNAIFVDHIGMFGARRLDDLGTALDTLRGLVHGEIIKNAYPFVCVASPLNRDIERGSEDDVSKREPRLSDFRGSAYIEHDADTAIILRKQRKSEDEAGPDKVEGYVLKQRDGPAPLRLHFWGKGDVCTVIEREISKQPKEVSSTPIQTSFLDQSQPPEPKDEEEPPEPGSNG